MLNFLTNLFFIISSLVDPPTKIKPSTEEIFTLHSFNKFSPQW